MITVEYERARGGRKKHERPDGFSISVSKTLPVSVSNLYRAFADAKTRAKWFPKGDLEIGKCTADKYWRAKWNAARLEVGFYAKGAGKAQVALQVNKLTKKSDVERERAAWKKAMEKLSDVIA